MQSVIPLGRPLSVLLRVVFLVFLHSAGVQIVSLAPYKSGVLFYV